MIGSDGEQLGIMSADEALRIADEKGMDLVKISPQAKPPVCKLMDYGKFRFEQGKREKEARKLLDKFAEQCAEVASLDKGAKLEGRNMSMFLSPKK